MANLLSQTNSVTPTESNVIYQTKLHWISFIVPVLLMIIGSVGVFFLIASILSGYMGIMAFFAVVLSLPFYNGFMSFMKKKKKTKILLNEKHLTIKKDFLSSSALDLALNKLEGMHLSQSYLGKEINCGTLIVSTGGVTQSYFIENPMELREQIQSKPTNNRIFNLNAEINEKE